MIKKVQNERIIKIFDYLVLFGIGVICLCYTMFWIQFAKIHIKLPFLNFPIFIGEILLASCSAIFLAKGMVSGLKFNKWHLLWAVYLVWVLVKAAKGYSNYGALSFRNAALFYYPLFALIGYVFFRKEVFSQKVVIGFLIIMLALQSKAFLWHGGYYIDCYRYPYFALSLFLCLKLEKKWMKYSFLILLCLAFPFSSFLYDSKSFVLGNLIALAFLIAGGFFLLNIKRWKKGVLLLCVILALFAISRNLSQSHKKVIANFSQAIEEFKKKESFIKSMEKDYKPREIESKLFDDSKRLSGQMLGNIKFRRDYKEWVQAEKKREEKEDREERKDTFFTVREHVRNLDEKKAVLQELIFKMEDALREIKTRLHSIEKMKDVAPVTGNSEKTLESLKKVHSRIKEEKIVTTKGFAKEFERIKKESEKSLVNLREIVLKYGEKRSVKGDFGNITFRLLIWKDMLSEIFNEKPFFGFSFGKPQRSKSIEILDVGGGEWKKQGWITPHNSYLHLIYRGGILGLSMICGLFIMICVMIRKILIERSFKNIILLSLVVYWMVAANFVLFLEFPYQAIPFWSYLGMLCAYVFEKGGSF